MFEECVQEMLRANEVPGGSHLCIGQEAAIVGACMAVRDDDYMTGNHRSHGHPIGKGAELGSLMAELLGKSTGVCRGKGGSMHLAVFSRGSLGESGIVGGLMPVAVGAGLSARLRGTDQVCLCFFGDGAANCGPFHESLNLAAIWKLPVIFLCENNGYAMFTPKSQTTSVANIAQRAAAYGMPGIVVDGQDVLATYAAVSEAADKARCGGGPSLIEAKTYRFVEHSESTRLRPEPYRSSEEIAAQRSRDPLLTFPDWLLTSGCLSSGQIETERSRVRAEVEQAAQFARASPLPDAQQRFEDL